MVPIFLSPEEHCAKVLTEIRSSSLHYLVQESPFSLYITIRKKFTKNPPKSSETSTSWADAGQKVDTHEAIVSKLESELEKKHLECNEAMKVTKMLEEKLEMAEAELYKQANKFKVGKDELSSEIKLLKENIKKSNDESKINKKSLLDVNRMIKTKEDENYALRKNLEGFQEKNKALKDANNQIKVENKKAEKANKKFSESLKSLKDSVSQSTVSTKETQTDPDTAPSMSTTSFSNFAHIANSNSLPNTIPSSTSEFLASTSMVNVIPGASKEECEVSLSDPSTSSLSTTSCPKTSLFSSTLSSSSYDSSITSTQQSFPVHPWNKTPLFISAKGQCCSTCRHPTQCTTRQPRTPPLPSITFLVNEKSKYHLHMMTKSADDFAGCFRCFSVENENYGCDKCTWLKWWFKWHGDRHGFPDISPWIYKKYL